MSASQEDLFAGWEEAELAESPQLAGVVRLWLLAIVTAILVVSVVAYVVFVVVFVSIPWLSRHAGELFGGGPEDFPNL